MVWHGDTAKQVSSFTATACMQKLPWPLMAVGAGMDCPSGRQSSAGEGVRPGPTLTFSWASTMHWLSPCTISVRQAPISAGRLWARLPTSLHAPLLTCTHSLYTSLICIIILFWVDNTH